MFLAVLMLAVVSIVALSKLHKLTRKYNSFMKNVDGVGIEDLLEKLLDDVKQANENYTGIMKEIDYIREYLRVCISKTGIIRYNAFENTGSDLSFSLALMNEDNSGVVITGLYSRDSSSFFAKPLVKGKSKYPLSKEEKAAIAAAENR